MYETREVDMETEDPRVPPSTPVVTSDMTKAFQDVRSRFNEMLDEMAKTGPAGALALAAVRCGGGCHQGVIE